MPSLLSRTHYDETYLVYANWLAVQAHAVHNLASIFGIFLRLKLDETIALVCLCDSVFRQVYVNYSSHLDHQLPDDRVRHTLVKVANVDRCFLVLLPVYVSSAPNQTIAIQKAYLFRSVVILRAQCALPHDQAEVKMVRFSGNRQTFVPPNK